MSNMAERYGSSMSKINRNKESTRQVNRNESSTSEVNQNDRPKLKANRRCLPQREINLLLLGQTGVGKSTFINGLVNYLCNDTLEQAVNDPLQSVIPSSFSFTEDNDGFQEKTINIGSINEYENFNEKGESCTQQCRSFVFPIGERNLRIIDAPGIGDTRGLGQDTRNFHDILTYISQYEHLNGICIFLKPNEERLNILFKFCVNELLRHIDKSASVNIIFIFTNARSTFFKPGGTAKILRALLEQHRKAYDIHVPFSQENSFLLDNEPFRYLALRRNGIQLNKEQTSSYRNSWDHTIKEYSRLVGYIVTRPLHGISNTLSLNEALQLVKKLTRPIAETTKLIEQNLQLAKQHKENVLQNPRIAYEGLPQNDVHIVPLGHPRTVCISDKCCRSIVINNQNKIEYTSKCHEHCYLKDVVQESIKDERLRECQAFDSDTGKKFLLNRSSKLLIKEYRSQYLSILGDCLECGCSWENHQHITYEYITNLTHLEEQSSLGDIDKRISDLREEKRIIEDVYKKLAKFLHANAILPVNDDIIEYLKHFIQEEQMNKNPDIVQALQEMIKDYQEEIHLFKETIQNDKDSSNAKNVLKHDQIFPLVGTLYRLPINGKKIRQQVDGLQLTQQNISAHREVFVELPAKANSSTVMRQFQDHVAS